MKNLKPVWVLGCDLVQVRVAADPGEVAATLSFAHSTLPSDLEVAGEMLVALEVRDALLELEDLCILTVRGGDESGDGSGNSDEQVLLHCGSFHRGLIMRHVNPARGKNERPGD